VDVFKKLKDYSIRFKIKLFIHPNAFRDKFHISLSALSYQISHVELSSTCDSSLFLFWPELFRYYSWLNISGNNDFNLAISSLDTCTSFPFPVWMKFISFFVYRYSHGHFFNNSLSNTGESFVLITSGDSSAGRSIVSYDILQKKCRDLSWVKLLP